MKEIICEFESEINHRIDDLDRAKALELLNEHLVGTGMVNKFSNGVVVENPKVTNHPNYAKLKEAHYKMFASVNVPIKVRVFGDGSHDIVPIVKDSK
jgi:hypothetical protein